LAVAGPGLTDHTIYPYAGSATVNPINPKNG
jgi:hypothetical protein